MNAMLNHTIRCYKLGVDFLTIPFKTSVLQKDLQNNYKFEFKKGPYAPLSLFTHFKMVKHEHNVHIQNPFIFLIILHILYVQFGVNMNYLLISKV